MTWAGVIDTRITSLVPIGSMLIANAMNTNSLVMNRFRSEVESHAGLIETGLALGADSKQTVAPYVQISVQASLIPAIDSLRSLGIVWIPGLMAGMLLSGASPIYAAIYQFVTISMIFSSSGLTALICSLLIRGSDFRPPSNSRCVLSRSRLGLSAAAPDLRSKLTRSFAIDGDAVDERSTIQLRIQLTFRRRSLSPSREFAEKLRLRMRNR